MKTKAFVSTMFCLVLAVVTTNGVSAQIFEDAFDLTDKAYVEGSGVLEYILYNLDSWWTEQDDPFDIFLGAYIRRLEKGQITTLGGEYAQYVVDYDSFYWVEDNTALSINVKRMMARHRYNVSLTHYQNRDGSTTFAVNYLNTGGKYEFFAFRAYKQ